MDRFFSIFLLLYLFLTASSSWKASEGLAPKFYVYPWSQEVTRAPLPKHDQRREFFSNHGIGQAIIPYIGLYETSPYSLWSYVLSRLLVHPSRTLNPSEASFFFVPFDLTHNTWQAGSFIRTKMRENSFTLAHFDSSEANDSLNGNSFDWIGALQPAVSEADNRTAEVIRALRTSPFFQRFKGNDHFFIEDDCPYFVWKHDNPSWRAFRAFCKKCVSVTPDNPWDLRAIYKHVVSPSTVISTPHPAALHHPTREFPIHHDASTSAVEEKEKVGNAGAAVEVPRPLWALDSREIADVLDREGGGYSGGLAYISTAIGTIHKSRKDSTAIRKKIFQHCEAHTVQTNSNRSLSMDKKSAWAALTWPQTGRQSAPTACLHRSLSKNTYKRFHGKDTIFAYSQALFCFCAPGDLLVRKALFDMILAGCIPVVFDSATVGAYSAFIAPFKPEQISVLIDRRSFLEGGGPGGEGSRGKGVEGAATRSGDTSSTAGALHYPVAYDPDRFGDKDGNVASLLITLATKRKYRGLVCFVSSFSVASIFSFTLQNFFPACL
jgi:hypothetical protein